MSMIDEEIVDLYWQRDEQAISQTRQKYGRYLFTIAHNILYDPRDSEESVSDTYLRAWKSMPPHRPQAFPLFWPRSPGRRPSTVSARANASKDNRANTPVP